jgi:hypothetical protein
MPYYLHSPRSDQEPAPGWYVVLADLPAPTYLGANSVDAEIRLRTLAMAGKL